MVNNIEYDYKNIYHCNDTFYSNVYSKAASQSPGYIASTQPDSVELSTSKSIKNKRKVGYILGATGLVLASATITALAGKSGLNIEKFTQNLTPEKTRSFITKTKDKVSSWAINFTTIKDDGYKRLLESAKNKFTFLSKPIESLQKFNTNITNGAKSISKKALAGDYEKAAAHLSDVSKGKIKVDSFDNVFNGIDETISKAVNEQHPTQGLFKGANVKEKLKGAFDKISSPLAENVYGQEVADKFLLKIPQDATEAEIEAIKKYNSMLSDKIIGKLRDYNCGSVPTDILTTAIPMAAFGVGLANTDSKEERKSILLNLGIPLVPTLLMPFIGYKFPVLNGIKAMGVGFAVGQVVTQTIKVIDRMINKKHNQVQETQK